MDDNQHLKRAVYCNDCAWTGLSGHLIAKHKLVCPKCFGVSIKYLVADTPEKIQ